MKYYLIAGEASGDLHGANLIRALAQADPQAQFRYYGGDKMREAGGTLVTHYKSTAYMGFVPVLLHLPAILRNMAACKRDVETWRPDALILIDYPGFNLSVAKHIKTRTGIPVFYYIPPKIWAWKEYRIKDIRRYTDGVYSILPFETDYYKNKHHYDIHYVGNPSVDAVEQYKASRGEDASEAGRKPTIALLPGSRRQEIKDNLPRMIEAAEAFSQYDIAIAGAPGIEPSYYDRFTSGHPTCRIAFGQTFDLLSRADAALVTSGTATLETALLDVPQVVCYYTACGKLVSLLRRLILKVPYVSLVNLIEGSEVVKELIADAMTVGNIRAELSRVLPGGDRREATLRGYRSMRQKLGGPGASAKAAGEMVGALKRR